jgi:hypothetical protein
MLPRVFLAFRAPVFGSEGHYAASMAGAILGLRNGSRLHRALVRERQVASEAHAYTYDLAKGADLLVIDAVARPEVDAGALERAVTEEVDRLREGGVTPDEVERALALIESSFVLAMQSAGERADQLSRFATYFGDPALANEQVDRYRAVTVDAVNAFARDRLGPDNRAYLVYVPRPADAGDAGDAGRGARAPRRRRRARTASPRSSGARCLTDCGSSSRRCTSSPSSASSPSSRPAPPPTRRGARGSPCSPPARSPRAPRPSTPWRSPTASSGSAPPSTPAPTGTPRS